MSGKLLVILVGAMFIGVAQSAPTDIAAVLLMYREICIARSGSDEGYQQVLASIQPARTCFLSRLDVQHFQTLQTDATHHSSESGKAFFKNSALSLTIRWIALMMRWKESPNALMMMSIFFHSMLKTVMYTFVDFACQDDGQFFLDAQNPEVRLCIAEVKEYGAQNCKTSDALRMTPISRYGEKECREIESVQACFKSKLYECNAPRLCDMYQAIFNKVFEAIGCEQYTALDENSSNNIDGAIRGK